MFLSSSLVCFWSFLVSTLASVDLTTGPCCPLRPCARLPSTLCTSSDFTSYFLILLNKPVVHPQLNPSLHFQNDHVTNGAFPLHGTTRLGTVQNGTVCVSSAVSTALEWAGLFTCRYSCTASTAVTPEKLFNSASLHQALAGSAPRLSTRGQSVLQQTTKQTFFGC